MVSQYRPSSPQSSAHLHTLSSDLRPLALQALHLALQLLQSALPTHQLSLSLRCPMQKKMATATLSAQGKSKRERVAKVDHRRDNGEEKSTSHHITSHLTSHISQTHGNPARPLADFIKHGRNDVTCGYKTSATPKLGTRAGMRHNVEAGIGTECIGSRRRTHY